MSDRKKKAAFFDIDGTIWNFQNEIPESTIQAIRELKKNGILTFINSGRTRAFIQNENLLTIGFDGIVSGCGTMIEYHGKTVFLRLLDPKTASQTLEIIRRYGFRPVLEGPEYIYFELNEFAGDVYGQKLIAELGPHFKTIRGSAGEWQIQKLSCATNDCDTASCYAELDRTLDAPFDYLIHNPDVVEIVPKGFSKGTAIEHVCELLNIDLQNTYSFGDSINDLEMIRTAGHGIAMGNGTDEIKAAADYVTTSLNEDGIWNACRHFGLI